MGIIMSNFNLSKNITDNVKKLYINALIIDPKTRYKKYGNLLTIGSKIADFGPDLTSIDAEVIDCQNNILCPGLIDAQVHFRDPGQTHKEDLTTGSRSAVAGGITTVVCQPNTSPNIDNIETLKYINEKAKKDAYCNILSYACITKEMKGEELTNFKSLAREGAVGFTDDGLPVMNAQIMRLAFEKAKEFNLAIIQHAEDLNLSNKGCINEGPISKKLNVRGIPNISESVIVERDIAILEATKSRYHLLHVSTKEALNAIFRAKDKNLNATVEACPHHFLLTDDQILISNSNAKMNPPLRSNEDRIAIIEGLRTNLIDIITTDHAPHDIESKNQDLSNAAFGIVGVETMLPLSLKLYHDYNMDIIDILAKMTCNPAKLLNYEGGQIKKGSRADLTLIDINHEWIIKTDKFYSKSKNSPFDNYKVKGRAIKTIINGIEVYSI